MPICFIVDETKDRRLFRLCLRHSNLNQERRDEMMPTATSTLQEGEHRRRDFLRPLFDLFVRFLTRRTERDHKPMNIWEDERKLQKALSAVRMAAKPGEDYDEVSERIEKEAAMYRDFLRVRTPIGKITLNVKRLLADEGEDDDTGSVYQVRDPAEGRASVLYSFKRSADIVLEFFVHDRHDVQLFPVARTYADWLGKRTFDLGFGRTFDLSMSEDECPGMVRVHARFIGARARKTADEETFVVAGGLPLAAGDDGDGPRKARGAAPWSFRRRVAFTFGVQCLVIFASFWAFRSLASSRPVEVHAIARAPEARPAVHTTNAVDTMALDNDTNFSESSADTRVSWQEVGFDPHTNATPKRLQQKKNSYRGKLTRIADVSGGRVKMDEGFCHNVGDQCKQWRANMQSAFDALKGILFHGGGAPVEPASGRGTEVVFVTYLTEGADSARVHVTLLTADAFFLVKGDGCSESGGSGAMVYGDSITRTTSAAGSDICRTVDSNEQPTAGSNPETLERRSKTVEAE
ncbi:MAG: hypothetical protein DMF67_16520 [Acidobacteria bacterium]|nr:MAG: hypothetical protein DMF67_16520 [Acidobacteriota bacterium]